MSFLNKHIDRSLWHFFEIFKNFFQASQLPYSLTSQEFSSAIANTSRQLEEFTMHYVIAKATYDFGVHKRCRRVRPKWSVYVRSPFNGKNVALIPTVGTVFSIDF